MNLLTHITTLSIYLPAKVNNICSALNSLLVNNCAPDCIYLSGNLENSKQGFFLLLTPIILSEMDAQSWFREGG